MGKIYFFLGLLFLSSNLFSQVYVEKQTRHRFAQLNLGVDFQSSFGGKVSFLNPEGGLENLDLERLQRPRFLIGGTHFWGHADIYIAIPLGYPTMTSGNQEINFLTGVETVFKYYPWRIEHNKIRPFIGTGITPFYFEQDNENLSFGNGPELNHTGLPLYTGLTFNNKNHLVELGLMWNYANKRDYYISRTQIAQIQTAPLYLSASYRYLLDTTLDAEKAWESGRTEEVVEILEAEKKLDGIYLGAGMSSAWWLGESTYNTINRPFVGRYSTSIMPDFTLGYYFNKADVNIATSYRGYGSSTNTYGAVQGLNRRSLVLEATKFIFDYHGFVPFVGPALSYERLSFTEFFENQSIHDITDNQLSYGLTFGWDVRPNRLQNFILRTNLRWFPDLQLDVAEKQSISFNNIEFNFIQLIIYPNRF